MKIIGLSGKMGSGKSTLANHIKSLFNDVVVEKVAGDLYGIQDYIYNRLGLTMVGEKDRPLLLAIGMWGRSISPSLWTDACFTRVMKLNNDVVIIDDIRFPEEALALEKCGGLLVRIDGTQRGPNVSPELATSASETSLDNWNFKHRINNQGTPQETVAQLEKIMKEAGWLPHS